MPSAPSLMPRSCIGLLKYGFYFLQAHQIYLKSVLSYSMNSFYVFTLSKAFYFFTGEIAHRATFVDEPDPLGASTDYADSKPK